SRRRPEQRRAAKTAYVPSPASGADGVPSVASALRRAAAACFFSCFRSRRSLTARSRAIFAIVCCLFALITTFLSSTLAAFGGCPSRACDPPGEEPLPLLIDSVRRAGPAVPLYPLERSGVGGE